MAVGPNDPTHPKMLKAQERRAWAMQEYIKGKTQQTIANELGISRPAVSKLIKRAMETYRDQEKQSTKILFDRENMHLEHMREKLAEKVEAGNELAIEKDIKISKAIRELNGLDKEKKTADVNNYVTYDPAVIRNKVNTLIERLIVNKNESENDD